MNDQCTGNIRMIFFLKSPVGLLDLLRSGINRDTKKLVVVLCLYFLPSLCTAAPKSCRENYVNADNVDLVLGLDSEVEAYLDLCLIA